MTVVWTRSADRDLAAIYSFFEPRSTRAVRTVLRGLFKAIDHLVEMPRMGKVSDLRSEVEYRELVVDHYKVYYRLEHTTIYVVRIWDTRRDPTTFFLPDDLG